MKRIDSEQFIGAPPGLWEELRGARIFISGGTGFFGCWLLESLLYAEDRWRLGVSVTVLTRSPERFKEKAAHLASHSAVKLVAGDVRNFEFPEGEYSHVIHAATEASAQLGAQAPLEIFSTIVDGTRQVLDFARTRKVPKVLLTSSGAVYGKQPADLLLVGEEYRGAPDPADPRSVYGVGKCAAEQLCVLYAKEYGIECKIARCFAFVGPYLPLDVHFAIGNFIRDALSGKVIRVNGDGTPYRSYLYASDLAIWLWTILLRGDSCRPYNVGSERAISIQELALTVADVLGSRAGVEVAQKAAEGKLPQRYVPSTQRARSELGLSEEYTLRDAILRTSAWHG